MTALSALIARVEHIAERGSRELDKAIYLAATREPSAEERIAAIRRRLGREPSDAAKAMWRNIEAQARSDPPRYSQSLDAKLPGEEIVSVHAPFYGTGIIEWTAVARVNPGKRDTAVGTGATEPLARRAAALRARESR